MNLTSHLGLDVAELADHLGASLHAGKWVQLGTIINLAGQPEAAARCFRKALDAPPAPDPAPVAKRQKAGYGYGCRSPNAPATPEEQVERARLGLSDALARSNCEGALSAFKAYWQPRLMQSAPK